MAPRSHTHSTTIELKVDTDDPLLEGLVAAVNESTSPAALKLARGALLLELGRAQLLEAGYDSGHRDGVDEADSGWLEGGRFARAWRAWQS